VPFSEDHHAIRQTVAAWRSGHNPDGRRDTGEPLEMAPDLTSRMLRGEVTPTEAAAEWAAREPQQRAFNDRIRRQAGRGFVADAEQVLDPDAGRPAVRDAQSGQFVDLGEQARASTGVHVDVQAAAMVPSETPSAPADPVRAAYWRAVDARSNHDRQGNDR